MLVLTRRTNEKIVISENITVRVVSIHGSKVRLAVDAPPAVTIRREEVKREKRAA